MKWLHDIIAISRQEMHDTLHDEGVIVFFIIVPLLYPLLYAYLYGRESVREVPTVVVDNANTSLSREFLRKVDATADVKIVGHCADMQEAIELVHRKNAYCVVYVPKEFESDLATGKQAVVELYSDMSGLLYYKAVYSACTEVSLAMNQDIKAQRLPGATKEQLSAAAYPIEYDYVPLFNTQNGFATFLIPAVLIMVIQQTLVLGVGMLAGDELEKRRKGIVPEHILGKSPLQLLLGRAAVYFVVYAMVGVYVLCLVPHWFHLIQIWQWRDLIAFVVPFLSACVFFSMTLSSIAHDREVFIIMFVFISVPLIFMSGISWPTSSIPKFWQCFSWLFPSTFGVNGFVRLGSMGALLKNVRVEWVALWIQTFVYFLTAWLVYKRRYVKRQSCDA